MPEEVSVEKIKSMVGLKGQPLVIEVEKGKIKSLAEAIGDPNPLWQDEAYARKSQYGAIVAPPALHVTHFMSSAGRPEVPFPGTRRLDGGGDWEFIKPIKAGDRITSLTTFATFEEREGKWGKMYFLRFETTFTNQNGELVGKAAATAIGF